MESKWVRQATPSIAEIRVKLSTSENYFGDEGEYKVNDVVVQTKSGNVLEVLGLDMAAELIIPWGGNVPLAKVDKRIVRAQRKH